MNTTIASPAPVSSQVTTDTESNAEYNIPLGRLRAFVTALVVAHHAVLAYHPWAPPPPASLVTEPHFWEAFPVVDAQRWTGWAVFAGWNDIFFMALMFFLSGLFVWRSLQRKGSSRFIRDRFVRLGLPFLLAAGLLGPLAYYPAYLQTASHHTVGGYWEQWRALGAWPAGPAWFLWVLLAFGCAAAGLYNFAPHWAESVTRGSSRLLRRPVAFFGALVFLSALAYVPMAMTFGPMDWKAWGPFVFQTSRIFLYGVYFAAGIILGAGPVEETLLSPSGTLAKRWIAWPVAAVIAFAAVCAITVMAASNPAATRPLTFLRDLSFPVSCAASSLALLSLFLRFAKSRGPLLDSFCAAAYGIYIIHYPIVSWTQYALLPLHLNGALKGTLVTVTALISSWALVALANRCRVTGREAR